MNPWSLLVSFSTLLVTASFAVGPSAAKAIEGMVLIVGRRPFDIGMSILILLLVGYYVSVRLPFMLTNTHR
jgi:hypothetical protein